MRTTKIDPIIVFRQSEEGVREKVSWNTLPIFCNINYSNLHKGYESILLKRLIKETLFKQKTIEDLLGLKRSAYFKLLKNPLLDINHVDKLAVFSRLILEGLEAFDYDSDDLFRFMDMENHSLGGVKPRELLFTQSGREELSNLFGRIRYGIYG